ncbi:hypothetical protein KIK06_22630 [Nocardiopsis sp. EMB25]|uniref:hypothetical protein n=1 Tax=Nocardiopsis sp. EMB25 TaxID=2835867 RepID=UPI0022833970|nr:hypothetical protein [Nocardiopsis sp. EMB25]MCY9786686.1 hypothetical protein [Nocardiopsis sp. EMB25]
MDRILARLDAIHARTRRIRWLHHHTWIVRILLAIGFLPSGFRKVINEPFTREESLGDVYIMFTALHQDFGALYIVIGICQMTAALLLLVPRTAALGAVMYLPLILGIVVLTVSINFGPGTITITCLMLLAAVYLLCWDWHRIRPIIGPVRLPEPEAVRR